MKKKQETASISDNKFHAAPLPGLEGFRATLSDQGRKELDEQITHYAKMHIKNSLFDTQVDVPHGLPPLMCYWVASVRRLMQ